MIGPQGGLQVDPNKDINIYIVLIAGRTVDDLSESKKRQDYENNTKPPLKVETWDTWIRKLKGNFKLDLYNKNTCDYGT
ncbi:DUF4263 domain-containing protein [Bacillus thuringiensis]|uniref:DUF4263 domain-containing protein n=1 Tax=Bacillus thuringiensis TaxID=1428 RepID=UPI00207A9848|nr:DUF4263 domain-containing protein [Bacillus thuringiensis]USL16411.1 DUF4263 domain-containing protein [Bacillus thuringiensis]